MAGLSSTLNIAQGALAAQQYGLNVTGNNIANVNNTNYSRQEATQKSNTPALYAGFLFGTGVGVDQIQQRVDQLLENRLTDAKSSQAAFTEANSYMAVLESLFDDSSETSINVQLTEFWNSWHDLADNPDGAAERNVVFENGRNFAARIQTAEADLAMVGDDINKELSSSVVQINSITTRIAEMNKQILGLEANRTANDLRDERNALVTELGTLIEVDTFEQPNGGIVVNVANGFSIVNGVDNYNLSFLEGEVIWEGSSGNTVDITDKIQGGQISGWLDVRDEILPKYQNELDVLAHELIWAVNYQHSQGAGKEYFTGSVTGEYQADDTGLFSSYDFGNKIDYANDFKMWIKDMTTADTEYRTVDVDMGISEAVLSDWQRDPPVVGGAEGVYKLTVVEGGTLGDKRVTETDGDGLGQVFGDTDVATALDLAIKTQTLTVLGGPNGTEKIEVKDIGGDAKRSAASIAKELNKIDGVTAHASETSATFEIEDAFGVSLLPDTQDGDEVKFSLYVDGMLHEESFIVDSESGTLDEQFGEALLSATEAVNNMNSDMDLSTDGLEITSKSGRTLGIQAFEVQDNAGISLSSFSGFLEGDTVDFTVTSTPGGPDFNVSVDLTGVDTSDDAQVATAFYDAINSALDGEAFVVKNDFPTNSVIIRTTDGTGITLAKISTIAASPEIEITALSGSDILADSTLTFGVAADNVAATVEVPPSADVLRFSGNGSSVDVNEKSVGGNIAGVIAGTVTVLLDPGMSIQTSVFGAGSGGLFDQANAKIGSSIITLGGEGGFGNFTVGEDITFEVDGIAVAYTAAAPVPPDDMELGYAKGIETALAAVLPPADYSVVRTGKSVSIIKNTTLDDPIEITDFDESITHNATLRVSTGTGSGANDPDNDLLDAANVYRDFSTSSLYSDSGIIKWEKYDTEGFFTGEEGLVTVEDKGRAVIENGLETISFHISDGSLVAGNTLTVNLDTLGTPDPLDLVIKGTANMKNETYQFSVKSGGKVGEVPAVGEEPIVIAWTNGDSSGTFEIIGNDPPKTPLVPVEVKVDGMTLKFHDGTLFAGDVFTITTDNLGKPLASNIDGKPTGELASSWHWTQDTFAHQFNTQSEGIKASVTSDNRLKFETSEDYHAMVNVGYSGDNGFSEDNTTITVKDWTSLNFSADDITFNRDASGTWSLLNDPTGGNAVLIPEGGDDDGFGVDLSGDGLVDIEIKFNQKVSGDGYVKFDLDERDADDMGFAFSNDSTSPGTGLVAAAGINTFFNGSDARTMEINQRLSDTEFIAAGHINVTTGEIDELDNSNAHALDNLQFKTLTMQTWNFDRGSESFTSLTTTTLDGYYSTMISSLGIESRSIKSSVEFAALMVNSIGEQRDSISAVSLDEEIINLMKYQHAFSAASKLVTVSDEMLNTLLGMR